MKIFMAGGTGFVGTCLAAELARHGHEITLLVRPAAHRGPFPGGVRIVAGDPCAKGRWQEEVKGHEAVINLAGASIFRLWTAKVRREILESRVYSTENIVEAMKSPKNARMVLLNASGVGYYGYPGDVPVDESGPPGDTFLSEVARQWEAAALRAEKAGIRVVLCRLGIVLGRGGGAFQRLRPLATYRLGAPWGGGRQWFSWIHEADVAGIVRFLLRREDIAGPINFSSPNPVTNREMMGELNRALGRRPFVPSIPAWVIRSVLGEFGDVFLRGQRTVPQALTNNGFLFRFADFRKAVADLIGP